MPLNYSEKHCSAIQTATNDVRTVWRTRIGTQGEQHRMTFCCILQQIHLHVSITRRYLDVLLA